MPRYRSRKFGDVNELFADRLVVPVHRVAVVDRGGPREVAVGAQLPVFGQLYVQPRFHLHAVGMHLLDVFGCPESFGRRQPDDPVVDVGVEPGGFAPQGVNSVAARSERQTGVVGEAVLLFQVGVAARQEVEVVQRREAVVARNGGLGDEVAAFRDQIVGEEGRNDRCPLRAEHLFAQAYRKAQALGGAVADRHVSRQFDASFVITDGHFGFVAVGIGRLLVVHRDDVFVDASY